MMSSFFNKLLLSAALGTLWACPLGGEFVCKNDTHCQYGSFCLKTDQEEEGLCSWGQWAQNNSGVWAIFPKIDIETLPRLQPNLQGLKAQTVLGPEPSNLRMLIRAYGANSLGTPSTSQGIQVRCEPPAPQASHVERVCMLWAHMDGRYSIELSAENENGQKTIAVEWTVLPAPDVSKAASFLKGE